MKCEPPVNIAWSPLLRPSGVYRRLFFGRRVGLKTGQTLPRLVCEAINVQIESKNLDDYRFVIQETGNEENAPLFYPHALFGSAHLLMIAHPKFPIGASGLLHLRNHVIRHRCFARNERWDMRCSLQRQRQVEKGLEFDFDSTITIDGKVVWESISTYLKRGKPNADIESSPLEDLFTSIENGTERSVDFSVPHNIGRRYAKVTGDYNPIHVSYLAAKLFGFKRAIAHGMWSVARSFHELPDVNGPVRHDVAFKGPMFVSSQATVSFTDSGQFEIFCGTNPRPVIVGQYGEALDSERLLAID